MKRIHILVPVLVLSAFSCAAQSSAFTYQGKLADGSGAANGTYEFRFQLFENDTNALSLTPLVTNAPVNVADGLFTTPVDFGFNPFLGMPAWLEIGVRTNGSSGAFTSLTPRQLITAAPHALFAARVASVEWGSIVSLPSGFADNTDNDTKYAAGTGLSLLGTNFHVIFGGSGVAQQASRTDHTHSGAEITSGTLADARLSSNVALLSGAPTFGGSVTSGGQLKGQTLNVGAVNLVTGGYASVAAGANNTNMANTSLIGGGRYNLIAIDAYDSVIGGGYANRFGTNANDGVIGGGSGNTIPPFAQYATIPGGYQNEATNYAFAAGNRAKARHYGTFVWADSQAVDFVSGKNNSFLIRASGGLGLNTNNPQAALHVRGNYVRVSGTANEDAYMGGDAHGGDVMFGSANPAVTQVGLWNIGSTNRMSLVASNVTAAGQFIGNGAGLTSLSAASVTSGVIADSRLSTNVVLQTSTSVSFAGTVTAEGDLRAPRALIGSSHLALWPLASAPGCSILGGTGSQIEEVNTNSTIAGGARNYIGAESEASLVGGGILNQAYLRNRSVGILSGATNSIGNDSKASVIGGGSHNSMGSGTTAGVVGGGQQNYIGGALIGLSANDNIGNTISGGVQNEIQRSSSYNTIGGGYDHLIRSNATYATIPGGYRNEATNRAFAAGYRAKARHTGSFVWADSTALDFVSDRNDQFKVRAGGGVHIEADSSGLNPAACRIESTTASGVGLFVTQTSSDANIVTANPGTGHQIVSFNGVGGGTLVFRVDNDGDVIGKTFTPTSDRNAKENFTPVDPQAVLDQVLALPISRWNFKTDDTQHIGPMAQDFYSAFAVGADDKHIATVDADGVALAAIQGLHRKVEEKEAKIADLEKRLAALEQLLKNVAK